MKKNKKQLTVVLFSLVALLVAGCAARGLETGQGAVKPGKPDRVASTPFPVFELTMPHLESEKRYLGLSGTGTFPIRKIKARLLIIEVFSFYCPHCQVSAAQINELYEKIQGRPDLKEKIKMIGIGVGNSLYEVNSFKERYQVPFPLFADQGMEISEMLGVRGTPTFIGVKTDAEGTQRRVSFHYGGFEDTQQFLTEMIQASGLEEEEKK